MFRIYYERLRSLAGRGREAGGDVFQSLLAHFFGVCDDQTKES